VNNRRKLVLAISAAAYSMPLRLLAQQQSEVWRVGFLAQRGRPVSLDADTYGAFPKGMGECGYVEGKNLVIEWRFGEGRVELLPVLAAELVRMKVDVIVASSTPATSAAQKATTTIPIVMGTIGDPVGSGFVKSLARPEGNITGLTNMAVELSPKHLEMLLTVIPKLANVAVLLNPDNSSNIETLKSVQAAAKKAGVRTLSAEARTSLEIESVFPMMVRERAKAVIIAQDGLFIVQRDQVAKLAAKHRLPAIGAIREYAEDGILMSYGPSFADMYRRVATYVDKILKGAKPGDLPVEQPTKFELFINHKTAKSFGLVIPQSLLISAAKVIE